MIDIRKMIELLTVSEKYQKIIFMNLRRIDLDKNSDLEGSG